MPARYCDRKRFRGCGGIQRDQQIVGGLQSRRGTELADEDIAGDCSSENRLAALCRGAITARKNHAAPLDQHFRAPGDLTIEEVSASRREAIARRHLVGQRIGAEVRDNVPRPATTQQTGGPVDDRVERRDVWQRMQDHGRSVRDLCWRAKKLPPGRDEARLVNNIEPEHGDAGRKQIEGELSADPAEPDQSDLQVPLIGAWCRAATA